MISKQACYIQYSCGRSEGGSRTEASFCCVRIILTWSCRRSSRRYNWKHFKYGNVKYENGWKPAECGRLASSIYPRPTAAQRRRLIGANFKRVTAPHFLPTGATISKKQQPSVRVQVGCGSVTLSVSIQREQGQYLNTAYLQSAIPLALPLTEAASYVKHSVINIVNMHRMWEVKAWSPDVVPQHRR